MGTNFHTPWVAGTSKFRVADMNVPLALLDRGITFQKNVVITCDGAVTYSSTTGVLSWAGHIHIYFNNTAGLATHNKINGPSSVTLSDNAFCYCLLSETNDAAISMSSDAITTGQASTYIAYNLLLLGYRNTVDDNLYGPIWQVASRSAYMPATLFDANSFLAATADNTPYALVIPEARIVGRITGGRITGLTAEEVKTFIGLATILGDYITKALFDANTILSANANDTPVAITIAEQQVVGRLTGGNIKGLSVAELKTLVDRNLTAAPTSNQTASGTTVNLTAGQTLGFGDACRVDSAGKMVLAKGDAIDNSWALFMCLSTLATNATGSFLVPLGFVRDDAWNFTPGTPVYLSITGTKGNTLTQAAPDASNNVIQILGMAMHADRMFFNPQLVLVEHT